MAFKAKASKASKAVEGSNPASWSVAQFSSFYTLNRSELIAHANRIVKDKAKAEEITQEALVKFMLAAPELSSDSHALSYLHRTIENLCIDLFRAENRRPNLVALDDATAEVESTWQVSGDHSVAISAAEDAAIIRQALSLLSPAERAALVMWEVEGRSTKEIAKELGIKESAVRHTVSRARASLRKVLSELVIDEARGLTALDLLSTTYKKAAEIAGKSSKIALTFILVLTAFLGLNSLTGNEPNTSLITTSSSQVNSNQDMPPVSESTLVVEQPVVQSSNAIKSVRIKNSISTEEYADHMQLSLNQLETVTLMLQVLEQVDGGPAPTE
jgi:RNA polymerase sigma factor (sigma-70 family)